MTSENDDPLLDAFLDEVLAQRSPPDLTARILAAWGESAGGKPKLNGHAAGFPLQQIVQLGDLDSPTPPPVQLPAGLAAISSTAPTRRLSVSMAGAVAASILAVGLSVGLLAVTLMQRRQLAQQVSPSEPFTQPAVKQSQLASDVTRPTKEPRSVQPVAPLDKDHLPSSTVADVAVGPAVQPPPADVLSGDQSTQRVGPERSSDAEIVAAINSGIDRLWVSASVKPSPTIADEPWCQRVYGAVLGRAARPNERRWFLDQPESTRREDLVNRLFTLPRYRDEFAQHWAAVWTTRLLGSRGGLGGLANREELEKHLAGSFKSDRPLNEIVGELLTATGSATPEGEDYNPAVNFLLDRWDAGAANASSRVARVLLGHHLRCAQCHEDPQGGFTQEQFWSLNAFFRQMRVERPGGVAKLVNVDFPGQRRGSTDGELFFETPTGLMKTAFPRFLDGTEIPASGMLNVVDRRRELARLVTQSDDFAQTTVNAVWAQLFRYGLKQPGDESSSTSLHGELLERLAVEFAAGGYDLKSLIRWAVLSQPFARSSELTDLASKDTPESGDPALFSRFYERPQATPDAVRLLTAAARIRTTAAGDVARVQARRDWLTQFNQTKTGEASKAAKTTSKTAPSILAPGATSANVNVTVRDGGLIAKLAASSMPYEKKVEHVFLTAVARLPSVREAATAKELLTAGGDHQPSALEDLWWALVNSSECVLAQ